MEAQHVVERPPAGADRGDGERNRSQDEVVLEATVGHPDAVLPMDGRDRGDHHGDQDRGRQRREEPEGKQRPTGQLGKAGGE